MKTFMEEYGLIIVALLVVAALVALTISFNNKATTGANSAMDKFTENANQAIDGASTQPDTTNTTNNDSNGD